MLAGPLLFGLTALLAQTPPRPAEVAAQIRARALDPARLAAEAQAAKGCREDLRPTFTGQFTGYGPGGYVPQGPPPGMPQDMSDAEVHTFPVPAIIVHPDARGLTAEERRPRYLPPEDRAPALDLPLRSPGEPAQRLAGFRGRVVVLTLFNPACSESSLLPELRDLRTRAASAGVTVLPLARTPEKALVRWRRANREALPDTFPIYVPDCAPHTLAEALPDYAISPTTYILDREGRIAWRICGAIPGALIAKINLVLSEGDRRESQEAKW